MSDHAELIERLGKEIEFQPGCTMRRNPDGSEAATLIQQQADTIARKDAELRELRIGVALCSGSCSSALSISTMRRVQSALTTTGDER